MKSAIHHTSSTIEPGATLAGAAILLTQPNPLLGPGLALLALPFALRAAARWRRRVEGLPLDVPLGLFVASAALGLALTSDPLTASIRWWGIVAGVGVYYALLPHLRTERGCLVALWAALGGGVFGAVAVVLLTQGQVVRGPLGRLLAPLLDWARLVPPLSEPVMETNTRFIVNYNGLGDLGLLVVVAGLLLASPELKVLSPEPRTSTQDSGLRTQDSELAQAAWRWQRLGALVLVGLFALLVLATGGRGSLAGLIGAALALALSTQPGGEAAALKGGPRESGPPFRAAGPLVETAALKGGPREPGLPFRTAAPPPRTMIPRLPARLTRPLVLAAGLLALALTPTLGGLVDKPFDLTLSGRVVFWRDLLAMLGDYGFTGLGLGMQAPLNAITYYGVTPSPETMVYAHNIFLQAYLEQGPLGAVSLALLVLVAALCGALALARPLPPARRAATRLGLAVLVGFSLHGLTDQVPTTNYGTLLLLLAAALAVAPSRAHVALSSRLSGVPALAGLALLAALGLGLAVSQPRQPADVLASLGGLEVARIAAAGPLEPQERQARAASAERLLRQALAWSPDHGPALRHLARLELLRNNPQAAAQFLGQATADGRLSSFDAVQVGRLYYKLGFLEEGYRWTRAGAQADSGMGQAATFEYYRLLLDQDWRVRTLVEQAEALRRQKQPEQALPLFQQALQLAPDNAYLAYQVEEVGRDVARRLAAE